MTNVLKFSHEYEKLPCDFGESVALVSVCEVDIEKLPEWFLDYDTEYCEPSYSEDGDYLGTEVKHYFLPKEGKFLVLTTAYNKKEMFSSKVELFTTIRRSTPEKKRYYESKIGEEFKLELEEKEVKRNDF